MKQPRIIKVINMRNMYYRMSNLQNDAFNGCMTMIKSWREKKQ